MLKRILIASLVMIGSAFAQERSITVASTTSTGGQVVRLPLAALHRGDESTSRWSPSAPDRRSTSGGAAMPTWCSCTTVAEEVSLRRLCPEAARRDVQRFCGDRTEVRSGPDRRRQGRCGSAAEGAAAMPFVSRAATAPGHEAELRLWKEAGVDPASAKPSWYHEIRPGDGRRAQHGVVGQCLSAFRSRHLAVVQEPRRSHGAHRGRQAAVQPIWRDAGQSGQAHRREGERGRPSSTG